MSYAQSAKEMNALMDAQITGKEFDEAVAKNKLLHDCKTKGFKELEALGLIKQVEKRAVPDHTPFEFATQAAHMVNNGMTITAACDKFGRNPGDLRYYCKQFGIDYSSHIKKRQWDYDSTYKRIYHFINRKGYRVKDVAKKLECSSKLIMDIIGSKGRKYNAKTIKIERIKL